MPSTLGTMVFWAHSAPNFSTSFIRLQVAASRMAYTRICPANRGMYSMMARRTLHLASSASSTMAGSSDWESWRMPMTSFTQSRLEMMLRRTSGHWDKQIQSGVFTAARLYHTRWQPGTSGATPSRGVPIAPKAKNAVVNVSELSATLWSSPAGRVRPLYLVLELGQEERQQVLDGVVLAQDGRQAHDDRGQRRLHMLIGV
ncbi:hypothetical protein EYF80_051262 [Liparis tanakae]|uniref:Uncharacterized protein n=1 Tax=Liparis tanakae TaxID=230148 RepID=A0A4Z2FBK4_9TELE|nr:hypothetical protein EYF80_051262 [Liparis tanakae]